MSVIGELFVQEELAEVAEKFDLYNSEEEYIITPEKFYDINEAKDIPTIGEIEIGDALNNTGNLYYKIEHFIEVETGEVKYKIVELSRGNNNSVMIPDEGFVDYIEYLKPIIADLRDGETDKLNQDDVDYLMPILRAKIEYHEGLISQEEYESIINF